MFWLWNGGVEEEFQCCGGALNTSMKGRQIIIQDVHCLLSLRPPDYNDSNCLYQIGAPTEKIEHNSALATFQFKHRVIF